MALPVILSAWVPTESTYYINVQVGTTVERLTFSVTAGREYWLIADRHKDTTDTNGVGRGDLVRVLTDCIETHGSIAEGDITASIAPTTGKLTITSSGSTFCVWWDQAGTTLDGKIFGFYDVSLSNAASFTGDHAVFGWWYPGRPASVDTRNMLQPNRSIIEPQGGVARTAYWGRSGTRRNYSIRVLENTKVLKEYATYQEESFEYHYQESIGQGKPFRIYEDSTDMDNGAAVYVLADSKIPYEQNQQYPWRWDVNLNCIELTPFQNTAGISQMFNSADPPESITLSRYWMGSMTKCSVFCRLYLPAAHATGATAEVIWLHASTLTAMAHGLLLHPSGTDFVVQWHEGAGGGVSTTGVTVTTGVHYAVLVVYDGTQSSNVNRLRIYVNGVDRTGTPSATFPTSTTASPAAATDGFECFTDFGGTYADCDDCYMSDLAIWHDQALSPAAAEEMYNGGTSIDLSKLVNAPLPARWWRLDGNLTAQIRTTNSTITASGSNWISGYPGNRS